MLGSPAKTMVKTFKKIQQKKTVFLIVSPKKINSRMKMDQMMVMLFICYSQFNSRLLHIRFRLIHR